MSAPAMSVTPIELQTACSCLVERLVGFLFLPNLTLCSWSLSRIAFLLANSNWLAGMPTWSPIIRSVRRVRSWNKVAMVETATQTVECWKP